MQMPTAAEPTPSGVSNGSDATAHRHADERRPWPRCEPALTHFELGASPDYRPTILPAKRYTPRYGLRKE